MRSSWLYDTTTTAAFTIYSASAPSNNTDHAAGREDLGIVVANISVDMVTACLLTVLTMSTFVQYFGRRSYRLVHALLCFRSPRSCTRRQVTAKGSFSEWKAELKKHIWIDIIMNSLLVFCVVGLFHQFLVWLFHMLLLVSVATADEGWYHVASAYIRYPRRLIEAASMWSYFSLYSFLIPVWLQSAMVWVAQKDPKRKILTVLVYIYVVLTNILIAGAFVPLIVVAFMGIVSPEDHPSIDKLRRTLIKWVVLPQEGIVMFGVTFFTIVFCTTTIVIVRKSMYFQAKNMIQVRRQINAIVRLSVGVVFLSTCVAVRLGGYLLYSIFYGIPDYMVYPLMKGLPDALFLFSINVVFWPWPIPCVGAPITLVHEFSEEVKHLKIRKTQQSSPSLASEDESLCYDHFDSLEQI